MNHPSRDTARLHLLMDACRADSDDVSLPEMADLALALREDPSIRSEWERRQRSERVVAGAMHDVAVPAGLAERILAAAAAAKHESSPPVAPAATPASTFTVTSWSRRRWLQWAGGIAAVFALTALVWQFFLRSPEMVSQSQLEACAQQWFQAALAAPRSPQSQTALAPVPYPRGAINKLSARSWWPLANADEASLVVFDLTPTTSGGRVFLFAAKTSKKYEVSGMPYTKIDATGGLEIGAWQHGGVIYVLVVDTQHSGMHVREVLSPPKLAFASPLQRR